MLAHLLYVKGCYVIIFADIENCYHYTFVYIDNMYADRSVYIGNSGVRGCPSKSWTFVIKRDCLAGIL